MAKWISLLAFVLAFSATAQETKQMRSALNFFTPAPAASSAKHVEDEVVALLHTGQGTISYTRQGSALNGLDLHPYIENTAKRSAAVQIEFADPLATRVNFIRRDASVQVKAYGSLIYKDVWPGVDLRFSGDHGGVLPELLLSADSDLRAVAFETGATNLKVLPNDGLSLEMGGRTWQLAAPNAVQQVQGKKQTLPLAFKPLGEGRFGLEWQQKPVADAVVSFKGGTEQQVDWEWGALIGGGSKIVYSYRNDRNFIEVDGQGNAYIVGYTTANDIPTTDGAWRPDSNEEHSNIFIAKFNAAGTGLEYCTYLGGEGSFRLRDMAVNSLGEVHIVGYAWLPNLPTSANAYATTISGERDAYIFKLNATGTDMLYGTYLGGDGSDEAYSLDADSIGRAVIVGTSTSTDFPTTPGNYQSSSAGGSEIFVTKLAEDGSSLVTSTLIGGSNFEFSPQVVLNNADEIFISGGTESTDFPLTTVRIGGLPDASNRCIFALKLSSDASNLLWSQTIGGSGRDTTHDIAVDDSDHLFIVGDTRSSNFPTTEGAYSTEYDLYLSQVNFISKIASDGTGMVFSSFFGSDSLDCFVEVDPQGRAIFGVPWFDFQASEFPPGYRSPLLQDVQVVVAQFNLSGTALEASAFLSGEDLDLVTDMAIDATGNIYVVGDTFSIDFPTTAGSFNSTMTGFHYNPFVAKFGVNGQTLEYCTYFNEGAGETTPQVEVDSQDRAVLATSLATSQAPIVNGAYDSTFNGIFDVVVIRFADDGQSLEFVTYVGGMYDDYIDDLVIGDDDSLIMVGRTKSPDFPVTANAFRRIYSGNTDNFIVKLSADGTQLQGATYLGGHAVELEPSVALAQSGDIFVAGATESSNFPVTPGAYDRVFSNEEANLDPFVTRFNPDLSTAIYSTLIGEAGRDSAVDIVVDAVGSATVVGNTNDRHFPATEGVLARSFFAQGAGFVIKLDPQGENLMFSTFLGRRLTGAVFDSNEDLVVFGENNGLGFEVTPGAVNLGDCYWLVAKMNRTGTGLLQASCLEKIVDTAYHSIDIDNQDAIYLAGETRNSSFIVTSGDPPDGFTVGASAVVTVFSNDLAKIAFSNWIGAEGQDVAMDVAPDSLGSMIVAGVTQSEQFPTTLPGYDTIENYSDIFVIKINPNDCDPPSISSVTGGGSACLDLPHTITVNTVGPGPKTYQWQRNGVDMPGETQSSLFFESISHFDSQDIFTCEVTSPCGVVQTEDISLVVDIPIPVQTIPTDQVGCIGQELLLFVKLDLNYFAQIELYLDNVFIASDTGNDLFLETTFSQQYVGEWRVQIVDDCGSFTAGTFTVSLDEAEVLPRLESAVQGPGLNLPRFGLNPGCSLIEPSVQWALTPSIPFTLDGNTLVFDEAPTEDILVQATVDYPEPYPTYEVEGRFIYTDNTGVTDVNGDGCNTEDDFIALAALWRTMVEADGDGDQIITVLDFPLLPANNPEACP